MTKVYLPDVSCPNCGKKGLHIDDVDSRIKCEDCGFRRRDIEKAIEVFE